MTDQISSKLRIIKKQETLHLNEKAADDLVEKSSAEEGQEDFFDTLKGDSVENLINETESILNNNEHRLSKEDSVLQSMSKVKKTTLNRV